ncbi:MAG: protein kinase [Acidobacteria bacterium]|nr:protein kinase [Acidobacteriota bacterium]
MNPDQEGKPDSLLKAALEVEPGERAAYLEEACAGDAALRDEVESLLASHLSSHQQTELVGPDEAQTIGQPSPPQFAREPDEFAPGSSVGPYKLLDKLGEGGMGVVYLAKDTRLGRRVALKLLPAHFAKDEELVRRFMQEARAASALNHPNVLTVHDLGQVEGRYFIATEFIEGVSLRRHMTSAPLRVVEALDIAAQVAGALSKAHAGGVVHRDIKPENIMVDSEGHVKVLDFGIAKQLTRSLAVDTEAPTSAQVDTAPGIVLGTATYMSPEQARGLELDGRTDVWSLGCVLYEMLAGRVPFAAPTYGDLIVAILQEDPPPLSRFINEPHEELELIVRKALAKETAERYQTARDLQADLRLLKQKLELAPALSPPDDARGASTIAGEARHAHVAASAHTLSPHVLSTGQRKQLTVISADLSGFTALTESLDAEEVSEMLDELWRLVDGVIEEHGGLLDRHIGDTFMALWGAQSAREEESSTCERRSWSTSKGAGNPSRSIVCCAPSRAPSACKRAASKASRRA